MKVRVLTYNIHKCIGGLDRRYDPERTCEVIADHAPDVVLLQEVAQGRRFGGELQMDRLRTLLGYRHEVHFVNVRRKRVSYGNAILSRFPLTRSCNIDVRVPPNMARSVLHTRCRVRLPPTGVSGQGRARHTRTLHVFNLHIGLWESERRAQLRRFLVSEPFRGLHARTPILVGGDFNDVWTRSRRYLEPEGFRGMQRPIRTFPAFAPVRPLDSLFVRGDLTLDRVFASRSPLARRASDHLPLIADLEITSGRARSQDA